MPGKRLPKRRRAGALIARWGPVVAAAAAGVMLSIMAYRIAAQFDRDRTVAMLTEQTGWRAQDIERRLARAADAAKALAAYITAEGDVTPAQFHRFATVAHSRDDLATSLYWSPWVNDADRAAFVAQTRRTVDASYDIRDITPDDRFVTAAQRDAYLPELHEESFDAQPGVLGFDLLFRPTRRLTIERLRDSATPSATAPFELLLGGQRTAGFVVFWPVYGTGTAPKTTADRRAAFRGIASARFRLAKIWPAVANDIVDRPETVAVTITGDADIQSVVPLSFTAIIDPAHGQVTEGTTPSAHQLTAESDFWFYGQHWTVQSRTPKPTFLTTLLAAPGAWLSFGLALTVVATLLVALETARVETLEVLARVTDERFRRIFDEAPIGMVIATASDHRFVRVNDSFSRMLGYSREEMIGRPRDDFAAPDSLGMPAPADAWQNPGWHPIDKYYVTKAGTVVRARVRVTRLAPTPDGEPLVLGLIDDVTEHRRLEDELRQSQKLEAIGTLTGGMAHDFNNLLGVIVGNLELATARLSPHTEIADVVGEALAAAERGIELTRRLLAFARRQPLQPSAVALPALITSLMHMLRRTLSERINVVLDLREDTSPVIVDSAQLEACITNLATNARDAMPAGGTLTVRTCNRLLDDIHAVGHPHVVPGHYAMIEISDTGSGMTPEVMAHIFEPFFTTKPETQGSGLGLSMTFGFVRQSNGHIAVTSEQGVGSTFQIYLPCAEAREPPAAPSPLPLAAPHRTGAGERLLLVEDNPQLRLATARQLRSLGYDVIEADGADAALAVMATQPIDLVFTDVVMPGARDGIDLTSEIRARWPSTRILLTSGYPGTRIDLAPCADDGAVRLLAKPYRRHDVARVVREMLDA